MEADMLMDRESFLRGVAALKQTIAEYEVKQRADKVIIHMPHNSAKCREAVEADYKARSIGRVYWDYRVGGIQSRVVLRKVWITALLVTYNLVRGKSVPYRVDRYNRAHYTSLLWQAQQIFDSAVANKPEVGVAV
jgi:hypothetical protein